MEKNITLESIRNKSYEEMSREEKQFFCENAHLFSEELHIYQKEEHLMTRN